DGKTIGTTPLTEGVVVGKRKLSIVADGYTTYEKDIYITKDCNEEINVSLKAGCVAAVAQTPTSSTSGDARKNTYKVGDYYDDGTKQGVVFYVDATGQHGKIVSIDQVVKQWCTKKQYNKKLAEGASSYSDGKANTDKVMSRSYSAEYPAFVWCRAKGKDWYLPARDELMLLYSVRDTINRTLKERGGDTISTKWHWPSTESSKSFAWYVSMYNGYTGSLDKYGTCYVRAVSAF
ncbi:MAG: PEGA domain-containing protein, partial [Alistipes sp.]|nr:PEGA domain-containing protein [Alistipes sp.]